MSKQQQQKKAEEIPTYPRMLTPKEINALRKRGLPLHARPEHLMVKMCTNQEKKNFGRAFVVWGEMFVCFADTTYSLLSTTVRDGWIPFPSKTIDRERRGFLPKRNYEEACEDEEEVVLTPVKRQKLEPTRLDEDFEGGEDEPVPAPKKTKVDQSASPFQPPK